MLLTGHAANAQQPLPSPGQILLAPLNLVRNTGSLVLSTGGRVVNAVPQTFTTLSNMAVSGIQLVPQTVNAASNAAVNTVSGVPGAFRTVGSAATAPIRALPLPLQRQSNGNRVPVFGPVQNVGGELVNAGATGLVTVANDGANVVTGIPGAALGLGGTAFRTGEAVVGGGARVLFATGDSAIRTGVNALTGGARVVLATADSGARLATDTMRNLF